MIKSINILISNNSNIEENKIYDCINYYNLNYSSHTDINKVINLMKFQKYMKIIKTNHTKNGTK